MGGGRVDADAAAGGLDVTFLAALTAPGQVRTQVELRLAAWGLAGLRDEVTLIASELVTNAVRHTPEREIRVRFTREVRGVLLAVWDSCDALPVRRRASDVALPDAAALEAGHMEETGGRGLPIVEALASACGVSPTPPRRGSGCGHVWRHDVPGRAAERIAAGRIAAERIKARGAGAVVRAVRRTAGRWRIVLDWRTCMGHDTAVRNLERLRVALVPLGWRCVALYDREKFRCPVPLLWVYWDGAAEKVWAVVTVRAVPGGMWAYFETGDGRGGLVAPCGNASCAGSSGKPRAAMSSAPTKRAAGSLCRLTSACSAARWHEAV